MPYFVVEGRGKDSGRKWKPRQYRAKDRDAAIAKAKRDGIIPERVELVQVSHFVTRVAGVSHKNPDNTSRQLIVKKCKPSEMLVLEHEEGNRYDKHAIRVLRANGEQVGYLPKELAEGIMEGYYSGSGCNYSAVTLAIERMGEDTPLLTLRLGVFVSLVTARPEEVAEYVRKQVAETGFNVPEEQLFPTARLMSRPRPKYGTAKRDSSRPTAHVATAAHSAQRDQVGCVFSVLAVCLLLSIFAIGAASFGAWYFD